MMCRWEVQKKDVVKILRRCGFTYADVSLTIVTHIYIHVTKVGDISTDKSVSSLYVHVCTCDNGHGDLFCTSKLHTCSLLNIYYINLSTLFLTKPLNYLSYIPSCIQYQLLQKWLHLKY